jgi:hypothetical protein
MQEEWGARKVLQEAKQEEVETKEKKGHQYVYRPRVR